jgi:hypothetical protein
MFGADIEFFPANKETGEPILVCGQIGGTKDKAISIDPTYSILEDGAALELNYKPAKTPKQFVDTIYGSVGIIKKFTKFEVYPGPEAKFGKILKKFPQAMEIGCVEDFDAYGLIPDAPRPKPEISDFGNYRFAGGHLHLSYENLAVPPWIAARLMDLKITLPLMLRAKKEQRAALLGNNRRKFYGLPGIYRPKPYGVEYRTLSNAFAFDRVLTTKVALGLEEVENLLKLPNENLLHKTFLGTNWDKLKKALITLTDKDLEDAHTG